MEKNTIFWLLPDSTELNQVKELRQSHGSHKGFFTLHKASSHWEITPPASNLTCTNWSLRWSFTGNILCCKTLLQTLPSWNSSGSDLTQVKGEFTVCVKGHRQGPAGTNVTKFGFSSIQSHFYTYWSSQANSGKTSCVPLTHCGQELKFPLNPFPTCFIWSYLYWHRTQQCDFCGTADTQTQLSCNQEINPSTHPEPLPRKGKPLSDFFTPYLTRTGFFEPVNHYFKLQWLDFHLPVQPVQEGLILRVHIIIWLFIVQIKSCNTRNWNAG